MDDLRAQVDASVSLIGRRRATRKAQTDLPGHNRACRDVPDERDSATITVSELMDRFEVFAPEVEFELYPDLEVGQLLREFALVALAAAPFEVGRPRRARECRRGQARAAAAATCACRGICGQGEARLAAGRTAGHGGPVSFAASGTSRNGGCYARLVRVLRYRQTLQVALTNRMANSQLFANIEGRRDYCGSGLWRLVLPDCSACLPSCEGTYIFLVCKHAAAKRRGRTKTNETRAGRASKSAATLCYGASAERRTRPHTPHKVLSAFPLPLPSLPMPHPELWQANCGISPQSQISLTKRTVTYGEKLQY